MDANHGMGQNRSKSHPATSTSRSIEESWIFESLGTFFLLSNGFCEEMFSFKVGFVFARVGFHSTSVLKVGGCSGHEVLQARSHGWRYDCFW